jgi:ribosome-associated translation inhibitor RaiA
MHIFFQTKKIELDRDEQDFMAHRVEGLAKFFTPETHTYIDVEKTRSSHNGEDLFYIAIHVKEGAVRYFVDGYHENVRKTFDNVYADLYRSIRNDRSKSRELLKAAQRKIKGFFKRNNK